MISDRFRASVIRHLVFSYCELESHPAIMGIFGPPGEGKTFQLRETLKERGVDATSINAAEFESDRAGQPGKSLLLSYKETSYKIEDGKPAALVIDDIDTTIGEWEGNTGTVNHQQLLAQLMHFADDPTEIERVGRVRRVPIFVTGNDFSKLYGPLRRPGRFYQFFWEPTKDERESIVQSMLADLLPERVVDELLSRHDDQPVAFFADLEAALFHETSAGVVKILSHDLAAVCLAPGRNRERILSSEPRSIQTARILDIAAMLAGNHRQAERSHLELRGGAHAKNKDSYLHSDQNAHRSSRRSI